MSKPTTQRAVRAGLRLIEAIPQISTNAGSSLQVHVGIATGLVVVGDFIGTGAPRSKRSLASKTCVALNSNHQFWASNGTLPNGRRYGSLGNGHLLAER
jgi:hypothetical protein